MMRKVIREPLDRHSVIVDLPVLTWTQEFATPAYYKTTRVNENIIFQWVVKTYAR